MQLELLSYQPTPEEMQPPVDPNEFQPTAVEPPQPIASPFKLGDCVRCPAGDGRVYHIHPNSVWVEIGNVARQWDLGKVETVSETAPVSSNAIAFLEAQAACHLRLIQAFMAGRKCSDAVRMHEIQRLAAMRETVLATIKTLEV